MQVPARDQTVEMAVSLSVDTAKPGLLDKVLPEGMLSGRAVVRMNVTAMTQGTGGSVVSSNVVRVAKTYDEVMAQSDPKSDIQKAVSSHEYIPLSLNPHASPATLTSKEVVFVHVAELAKQIGVKEEVLKRRADGKDIKQNASCVTALLVDRLKLNEEKEFSTKTLREKLNAPIQSETVARADKTLATFPRLDSAALRSLGQNQTITSVRTQGSASIEKGKKSGNEVTVADSKAIAGQNWKEADSFVRELAISGKPLTFKDLCKVNEMLYKNMEMDDKEKKPGETRNHIVTVGGFMGCSYLHQAHVNSELKDLMKWMDTSVQACRKGKENPIVVAAQTFQKMVSIHPFSDGNGRTSRLAMDYVLQSCGLPPAALGHNVDLATFGTQEQHNPRSKTPTQAVDAVIAGVENTYNLIKQG